MELFSNHSCGSTLFEIFVRRNRNTLSEDYLSLYKLKLLSGLSCLGGSLVLKSLKEHISPKQQGKSSYYILFTLLTLCNK